MILLLFGVFLFVRFCFVFVSFHLFSPSETKVGLMKKELYFCWILLCKMWTNRTFWKSRLPPETHSREALVWSTQVLTVRCPKPGNNAARPRKGPKEWTKPFVFPNAGFCDSATLTPVMAVVKTITRTSLTPTINLTFFFLKMRVTNLFLYLFFYIFIMKTSKHHRNKEYNELPCTVTQLQKHQHLPFFEGTKLIIFPSNELCKMSHCGCSLQVHIFSLESDDSRSVCCAL